MQSDELCRSDWLRLVAAGSHDFEVTIFRDDEISVGYDGTVGKSVVVGIDLDELETESRGDEKDVSPYRVNCIHRLKDEGDIPGIR